MRRLRTATVALAASALLLSPPAPIASAAPAAPAIVAITAGGSGYGGGHTCELTDAGGVKCWGSNEYGQLGDGTTFDRSTPVDVTSLARGVTAISAGDRHTCAVTDAGGVKCWGYNGDGGLGDGTTTDSVTPVDVQGLASRVIAVAAGDFHTCALTSAGGVKCWGYNRWGQLGDGTTKDSRAPVDVKGLASGATAIAAGWVHSCAVTAVGAIECWGSGPATSSLTPVGVPGLASGAAAVAAGYMHTCAVTTGGAVKCWGYNASGQLGDGTTEDSDVPVAVSGIASGATAVSVRLHHSCAVTATGGVECWGSDRYGQLGDGRTSDSPVPVAVSGLASGAKAVAAGAFHTCAIASGGTVTCWGANDLGQLGNGTMTDSSVPVQVAFATQPAGPTTAKWRASVGASGANGTATLTTTGTKGTLTLVLKALARSATYPVRIVRGTCAKPGSVVWAAPTQTSTRVGKIAKSLAVPAAKLTAIRASVAAGPITIRIGSGSRLRCGAFTGAPAPTPVAATPTPSPSPLVGWTMHAGPYIWLALPTGWSTAPPPQDSPFGSIAFRGPGVQWLAAYSVASTMTSAEALAAAIANLKRTTGADPEKIEDAWIAGNDGKMLTAHFSADGKTVHFLEVSFVNGGRAYEIVFTNAAGAEEADRALFSGVIGSFQYGPGY